MKIPLIRPRSFLFAFKALRSIVFKIIKRQPLFVTEELEDARLKICLDCEHITELNQCSICTCAIALKVMLDDEYCPKHFW